MRGWYAKQAGVTGHSHTTIRRMWNAFGLQLSNGSTSGSYQQVAFAAFVRSRPPAAADGDLQAVKRSGQAKGQSIFGYGQAGMHQYSAHRMMAKASIPVSATVDAFGKADIVRVVKFGRRRSLKAARPSTNATLAKLCSKAWSATPEIGVQNSAQSSCTSQSWPGWAAILQGRQIHLPGTQRSGAGYGA